jgi:Rho GDP-dissociation inhibitor
LFSLDTKEKVDKLKATPITIKEGTDYQFECTFKIHHDIVSALKFVNTVSRGGIKLEKKAHMMGSYGPNTTKINSWKSPIFTAPAGMLARGTYKAVTQFIDDDKVEHLSFDYSLQIKTDWEK